MSALVANSLKILFVGLLYLFLWQVARGIGTHLGAGQGRGRSRKARGELVIVKSETQAGTKIRVDNAVVLGRGADADFYLEDAYSSAFHLRLAMQGDTLMLTDLGTTNGTYVNGRRVTTPVTLAKGDAVQVGKTILEVR